MPFVPVVQSRILDVEGWYYEGSNRNLAYGAYLNGEAIMCGPGGVICHTNRIARNKWRHAAIIHATAIGKSIGNPAFGAGVYVFPSQASDRAVYVASSLDSLSWSQAVMPGIGGNLLSSVIFGNSLFVAFGTGGYVATSPDGTTWTQRTSGTSNALNAGTYGAGLFCLVGAVGTIITSPDGITWTTRTSSTTAALNDIVFAIGLFIAVGAAGGGNTISRSIDGITWTRHPIDGTQFTQNSVTYVSSLGLFITTGSGIQGSATGLSSSWSAFTSPAGTPGVSLFSFRKLLTDGTNVAIGNEQGYIFVTNDFITYNQLSTGLTGTATNAVRKFQGNFFCTGGFSIFKSPDLRNWSRIALQSGVTGAVNSSMLLFLGLGTTVHKTTNGTSFSVHAVPTGHSPTGNHGCIWVESLGLFVGVSSGGRVCTSPDGETWTERYNNASAGTLNSVAWTGSLLVATSSTTNQKLTSSDGITWTLSALGVTASLTDIVYGNGLLVAINSAVTGGIAYSANGGTSWTLVTAVTGTPGSNGIFTIEFDGGKFVVLGGNKWARSEDAVVWTVKQHSTEGLGAGQLVYDEDTNIFVASIGNEQGLIAGRALA